jgi:hypothetical protein
MLASMRTLYVTLFALLALQTLTCAAPSTVAASELSVAKIRLGQDEITTIRRLGRPLSRSSNDDGIVLSYVGLTITLGVGTYGVYDMQSTNPNYCTPRKACPGMKLSRLKHLYGTPIIANREEGRFLEYYGRNTSCWLQISAANNVVTSIRVACQP